MAFKKIRNMKVHKKKLSDGGTHDKENLIALCKSCYSRIHAEQGRFNNSQSEYTY